MTEAGSRGGLRDTTTPRGRRSEGTAGEEKCKRWRVPRSQRKAGGILDTQRQTGCWSSCHRHSRESTRTNGGGGCGRIRARAIMLSSNVGEHLAKTPMTSPQAARLLVEGRAGHPASPVSTSSFASTSTTLFALFRDGQRLRTTNLTTSQCIDIGALVKTRLAPEKRSHGRRRRSVGHCRVSTPVIVSALPTPLSSHPAGRGQDSGKGSPRRVDRGFNG